MLHIDKILKTDPNVLANKGNCIAGADGEWIAEAVLDKKGLIVQEIDFNHVYKERQNFDSIGHYSSPEVTKLIVNKERQFIVENKK